jgi:putative membrane-bound dehydrogenase-like protein
VKRLTLKPIVIAAPLLAAVTVTAGRPPQTQSPPQAPVTETRDRYLNPRETDISLALKVDPKDVPDVPPVEPDKALDTFRIKKGFRLELVAHEPQTVDPVQIAFDEDGRLYVVEMRWYQSETRNDLMFDERLGQIRLLEDTNADGVFEKSTIFADKLRYPSAVFPYDGGVYVGVEPDIIYLKDRNGDGVADLRQVVFTGFGNHRERLDSQTFLNSLTWGLDNRIHGVKGHGGTITSVAAATSEPLDLRNRDFSFDPRTHHMRPESGGGKQGLTFDDYGRKFVCTQTNTVQMLMYEDRYAGRNPHYAPPRAIADIALEPGETNDRQIVHRISPEDPWRRVRNRWRAEGVFAGPAPQPPAYLIGASGVTLYRGHLFPEEYRHSAFVGVAGNNLVHHRTLTPNGVGFEARRPADEAREEFLASTDLWFRPVAFANGPDGALYIADLYREILDFSDGIPESIKRFKDLNRGNDRGRIYRVVPERFERSPLPRLGRFSTSELVTTLEHPNAWHRETAARLLYTRQDKSAIPSLARLTESSSSPLGRLHAVYALDGLGALAETYVVRAMADSDPGIREHGVRLSERIIATHGLSESLWHRLKSLVDDPNPRVRYQLAFTLGEIQHPDRIDVLAALLEKDVNERWMHAAALTSLADGAGNLFSGLSARPKVSESTAGQAFLTDLMRVIGHRNRGRELLVVLNFLAGIKDKGTAYAYTAAFADGLQRADVPLALFHAQLQPTIDHALATLRDAKSPEPLRLQAVELLGLTTSRTETLGALLRLIESDQNQTLRSAAITAVGRLDDPSVASLRAGDAARDTADPAWQAGACQGSRRRGGERNGAAERAHSPANGVSDGAPECGRSKGSGRRLQACRRPRPSRRSPALHGSAESSRQRPQGTNHLPGAMRCVPRALGGRHGHRAGNRLGKDLPEGRDPDETARPESDDRCTVPALYHRNERRKDRDRYHPERVADQPDAPASLRPTLEHSSRDHRAHSEPRAVDDARGTRRRTLAAGHGGSTRIHRDRRRRSLT